MMIRKARYWAPLLLAVVLMSGGAFGLTVEQADSVILGRFTDFFDNYYEQNVLVYDGTNFFTATALARSGRREIGASGYDLTNTCIAATTASGVDSAGAREEGCTTMLVNAASYSTILSLQSAVEDFIYANVEDTALITGTEIGPGDQGPGGRGTKAAGGLSAYPNPFRGQVRLSATLAAGRPVLVYDCTGALRRHIEWPSPDLGSVAWDGRDDQGRPGR